MNYLELYERLGDLYYAVAAADREVHHKESERLKSELDKIWLPAEDSLDRYGTDAAHYIWMSFESNDERSEEAGDAFDRFSVYYHDRRSEWTPDLKSRIEHTAAAIANAYSAYNKSELGVLAKLHQLLEPGNSK